MPTATNPTLGGTTLPMPYRQDVRRMFRGGQLQMADGSIVIDLVDATARHRFSLRFRQLTATELGTLKTKWDSIKNTTATYVSIENTSHTVTQPDGAELTWSPRVTTGGEIMFDAEMELIEDS